MVIRRGEMWWAELPSPVGSEPGYRRPVLIVQSDDFNRSRIATVIAVVITSNMKLDQAPGNVFLSEKVTGLLKDSVVNVSQVVTIDKSFLTEWSELCRIIFSGRSKSGFVWLCLCKHCLLQKSS